MATNNAVNDSSAPFTVSAGNLTVTSGYVSVATNTSRTAFTTGISIGGYSSLACVGTDNADMAFIWAFVDTSYPKTSNGCVVIGAKNGESSTYGIDRSVVIGTYACQTLTSALGNSVVIGLDAGRYAGGSYQTILGARAGRYSGGTDNVLIGDYAGERCTGTGNVAIGYTALFANAVSTSYNVAIGYQALLALNTAGGRSVGVGYKAGSGSTTGLDNTYIGYNSGSGAHAYSGVTSIGSFALSIATTPTNTTACGFESLKIVSTGTNNTAYGYQSGVAIETGSKNCFYGDLAGSSLTGADHENIMIGSGVTGTAGDVHTTRIGTGILKCWISGIRGITTDVNDAVAVLIDSTGQLGTTSSSIRYKDNIVDLGDDSSPIYNLRPVSFTWKDRQDSRKTYGLIAEEVAEVFPYLAVLDKEGQPETVKYHELPTLLLNEVKKLNKRIEILEAALLAKGI